MRKKRKKKTKQAETEDAFEGRVSHGAARGGRGPPSLTGPPSLPRASGLGWLSSALTGQGRCLLTPQGGGRAAARPARPSGPRGAGSRHGSQARGARGAMSAGRADAMAARVERRPAASPPSPVTTSRPSGAESRAAAPPGVPGAAAALAGRMRGGELSRLPPEAPRSPPACPAPLLSPSFQFL